MVSLQQENTEWVNHVSLVMQWMSSWVRYWYTGVMRELKLDTAYQAERQIEPEHFHVQDLRTVYPGKWRRYAVGENTPQKKPVRAVDLLAKGSAYELIHPLWLILKN